MIKVKISEDMPSSRSFKQSQRTIDRCEGQWLILTLILFYDSALRFRKHRRSIWQNRPSFQKALSFSIPKSPFQLSHNALWLVNLNAISNNQSEFVVWRLKRRFWEWRLLLQWGIGLPITNCDQWTLTNHKKTYWQQDILGGWNF